MNLDHIQKLQGSIFHNASQLAEIEQEVRSIEDAVERESLWLALGMRLVDEWALDEAERVARSMESIIEKTWLFARIASKMRQLKQKQRGLSLLDEALTLAYSLDVETILPWQRAETLTKIAACLIEFEDADSATEVLRQARAIAEQGRGDIDASSVLWEIAEELVLAGEWEEARQVAIAIDFDGKRQRAVTRVEKMISIASK